jgi:hypothetical protein
MHSRLYSAAETRAVDRDTYRFTIDTKSHGMKSDWPAHVYWLIDSQLCVFPGPKFWSERRRRPAVRMRIEVQPLPR